MGNDLETERLLYVAENGIFATRQQKTTEDNQTDFYLITLFRFRVLCERWVCKDNKNLTKPSLQSTRKPPRLPARDDDLPSRNRNAKQRSVICD